LSNVKRNTKRHREETYPFLEKRWKGPGKKKNVWSPRSWGETVGGKKSHPNNKKKRKLKEEIPRENASGASSVIAS